MGNICEDCEDQPSRKPKSVDDVARELVSDMRSSNIIDKEITTLDLSKVPKKGLMSGRHQARVMRVYDGDTMTVAMAPEFKGYEAYQLRLYGCDAPEAKGSTKTAGLQAKNEVLRFINAEGAINKRNGREMNEWFQANLVLITVEFMSASIGHVDKYGRELVKIEVNGKDLTTHMIKTGLSYAYQGGTKDQSNYQD